MKTQIVCLILIFLFTSCSSHFGEKAPDTETIRLYARASDVYAQGRFTEVINILQEQNNFPPALILRAKAEYFSGDLERAEKSCRRAIKLRPSLLEANLYLARILKEKNNLTGAQSITETLLADNPQDIRALRLAAEISFEAGRLDEALALLNRAADSSAESAMVLLDRAKLLWTAGNANEAALEDLSRARAMLPWDTPLSRSIQSLENIIKGVM